LLIAKCYEICCDKQAQFVFGICNLHLPRLYEQMGFHRYTRNYFYPNYGLQIPIVLLTDDIEHFRKVRSPFFRLARKRESLNTQAVEWFHSTITQNSYTINSQLIKEEELWSFLCTRLNCLPNEAITILRELAIPDAKKILHCCSTVVQCDAGDIITNQGDISYSYNILISGKLKSETFYRPVREYTFPGQCFGANGLTEHKINTEDIVASESSEILVFSGFAYQKFFYSYPEIAHKVVRSIVKLRSN
jgi:hypothetical protein